MTHDELIERIVRAGGKIDGDRMKFNFATEFTVPLSDLLITDNETARYFARMIIVDARRNMNMAFDQYIAATYDIEHDDHRLGIDTKLPDGDEYPEGGRYSALRKAFLESLEKDKKLA